MAQLDFRRSEAGRILALDTRSHVAVPYSHWVFENVLDDDTLFHTTLEWPDAKSRLWVKENGRFTRKWSAPPPPKSVFEAIAEEANSARVLALFAELLGEPVLHADATYYGGGLHHIPVGGFLNMHTDFQYHKQTRRRRVANFLLYLNPTWDDSWNGHLELGMAQDAAYYAPIGGRALLFRTTTTSWHGHPAPLCGPCARRSMALYYYGEEQGDPDTTRYIK